MTRRKRGVCRGNCEILRHSSPKTTASPGVHGRSSESPSPVPRHLSPMTEDWDTDFADGHRFRGQRSPVCHHRPRWRRICENLWNLWTRTRLCHRDGIVVRGGIGGEQLGVSVGFSEKCRYWTSIVRRPRSHRLDFEQATVRELRAIRVPISQLQKTPARVSSIRPWLARRAGQRRTEPRTEPSPARLYSTDHPFAGC